MNALSLLAQMKGAIFDVDGTLLDSSWIWNDAGARFLNSLGREAEEDLGRTLFSMSLEEGASYMRNRYGLAMSDEAIICGVLRVVENFYLYDATLKPGAADFLRMLGQRGIPMVVLSSSDQTHIRAALGRVGILDCFEEILTCSRLGVSKNDPRAFYLACERLGTEPDETWVFEDALYAVHTAKAAGLHTAGIFDEASAADQEELRQTADLYLTDWGRLTDRSRLTDWDRLTDRSRSTL